MNKFEKCNAMLFQIHYLDLQIVNLHWCSIQIVVWLKSNTTFC